MKNLFIRCSQETYELAHALAKKESRSLNKQIIHMIHNEADVKGVELKEDTAEQEGKMIYSGSLSEPAKGLSGLVETKTQDFPD
jgi:hypothetical protein|tara:strand:+ start:313 stop:564 length:252 start_codon:yes stop_codon:yes gene_type:complete